MIASRTAAFAIVATLMLPSAALACDLDGMPGAHRFSPFQAAMAHTYTPPPPPAAPPQSAQRVPRPPQDTQAGSVRRQNAPSSAGRTGAQSDAPQSSGTPGDADWIHSARDR